MSTWKEKLEELIGVLKDWNNILNTLTIISFDIDFKYLLFIFYFCKEISCELLHFIHKVTEGGIAA